MSQAKAIAGHVLTINAKAEKKSGRDTGSRTLPLYKVRRIQTEVENAIHLVEARTGSKAHCIGNAVPAPP
jgi:hypothetical protein